MLKQDARIMFGPTDRAEVRGVVRSKEWAEKAGLKCPEGMVPVEGTTRPYFAKLASGTQRRHGENCPVVQLFYVTPDGTKGGMVGTVQQRFYLAPKDAKEYVPRKVESDVRPFTVVQNNAARYTISN